MMVQAPEMQKGTEQAELGPQGLTLYQGETENQQINKKNRCIRPQNMLGRKRQQRWLTKQKHQQSRMERDGAGGGRKGGPQMAAWRRGQNQAIIGGCRVASMWL